MNLSLASEYVYIGKCCFILFSTTKVACGIVKVKWSLRGVIPVDPHTIRPFILPIVRIINPRSRAELAEPLFEFRVMCMSYSA